jgi:hypothetical protein
VRWVAALLVALLLCGCSSAPAGPEWKAVIRDALDGRLDRSWSCSSLRAAVAHLPQDVGAYQTIPLRLDSATGRACNAALAQMDRGLTRAQVTAVLGPPDRTPRCWLYSWPPEPSSAVDGARLCFSGDRVALVQTAVHL